MRNLLSTFVLFAVMTLSTSAFGQPPPPVNPGPPVSADLVVRLLRDTRTEVENTPLEALIRVRFPADAISSLFEISVLVDGLVKGNDITGVWFHCVGNVLSDHDTGLGGGAFLDFLSRDFFLFSKDSAMMRTSTTLKANTTANECYGAEPGHIPDEIVYEALLDRKVYIDLHTTNAGANPEIAKQGNGEIGAILCLPKNRTDLCLP